MVSLKRTRYEKILAIDPNAPSALFVAAREIETVVIGLSPKTLANWRSYGRGPKYYLKNGSVYYRLKDLDDFFGQNPVETDEEKVKNMEDGNAYKCL